MRSFSHRTGPWTAIFCGLALAAGLVTSPAAAADYGRLSGVVQDTEGNPLMGATVLLMGPLGTENASSTVERVLTDADGKFVLEHLLPGWYSLRVFSPTRLPAARNRVRVSVGENALEKFVLGDIFAPLRVQIPATKVSNRGDDWKWILRTSASTRPVLRFRKKAEADARADKPPLPSGQRLIGVLPGSARHETLADDRGMGSVLAYFRPLSEDTDMLVAGSMTADGLQASSLATAFRRNLMKGDPQELSLSVHQLRFADGVPLASGEGRESLSHAQAFVVSYAHTRHLSDAVSVTAGFEVDYLTAATDAMTTRPHVDVEYRLSPVSLVAFRYGALRAGGASSLLDRIGELNAFPRISSRDFRPRLERLNHTELSYQRRIERNTRLEVAAYRDSFQNAAVWGFGNAPALNWLAGNFLPNSASNGVTLNAGDYGSSGMRVAVVRRLGSYTEAAVMFSSGEALAFRQAGPAAEGMNGEIGDLLCRQQTRAWAGKVSTRVPSSRTEITTSYQWIPRGRVTGIDPYGATTMDTQPYLSVEIRQPLPTLDFFPAHIEAMADFSNLLAEGYVPFTRSGDRLLLTPAYRSFRGGFSVEF